MTEDGISPATRRAMQGNRSRDTKPELLVRSIIHRRGLRYRVSARPLPDVRRTADLVFRKSRVAVFVDGCFWHGCPDHHRLPSTNVDYWSAKIHRNQARDREVDDLLARRGWLVIRAWEHESPEDVAERVIDAVTTRLDS